MIVRRFFLLNVSILWLIVVLFLPLNCWGLNDSQNEFIYHEGRISDALFVSTTPDKRTIGVYLTVAIQNELSPQEWASTVEKYFKAYGFPVKIILDHRRPKGKGATAVIYIGAKAYEGNLSSGSISLSHLISNHKKVFAELLELYKKANPDLFTTRS